MRVSSGVEMPGMSPRRSPEIEALVKRVLDSLAAGDNAALRRIANPGPEFVAIGTDPTEWWDAETFLPVMEAQMGEMAGLTHEVSYIEGWELDRVGWAASRLRMTLGGADVEMRLTAVLVLDAGLWRTVQLHASEGVPNEESLGFSLTTTLSEMLDSLDERDVGALPADGMVILMFTDVEGSTRHARDLGDRQFARMMAEHVGLVSRVAGRWQGKVIKTVGDGALLAFSSARSAVASAVEIQRQIEAAGAPYQVRIGIHAGDVVRTDSDVMGFAVNKAARVASAAAGGQVVVSAVVRELVGYDPALRFEDSFLAELRGIEGVHELVPVAWREARTEEPSQSERDSGRI